MLWHLGQETMLAYLANEVGSDLSSHHPSTLF